MQIVYKDLLEAIKNDNAENFSVLFNDKQNSIQNICFGRFPLLSLCYLYNSKNILKKFEHLLLNIRASKIVEEPFEIYQKFKNVAGRALRLYVEGQTVWPIEMLAILGQDKKVKKLFKLLTIANKNVENLKAIYYIKGQNFIIKDKKLKLSKSPLSSAQKNQYKIALFASITCVFVLSCVLLISTFVLGFGIQGSMFKIYSQAQLYSALNSSGSYVLQSDITLDDNFCIEKFEGYLDGSNHRVYINSTNVQNALIKINKGNLKNIKLIYNDIQKEISSNFSMFVGENYGSLNNVEVVCKNLNLLCSTQNEQAIFANGIANINKGNINNCSVDIIAQVTSNKSANCYLSGIVGENYSIVSNCTTLKDCKFQTTDAQASGIVIYNDAQASVENCKNNALICGTSASVGWSPKISGVVLTNYGVIKKCFNLNALQAHSTFEATNATGNVFLGGISCYNYGVIDSCLNKADLEAKSKSLIIYCGGIVAHSSYYKKDSIKIIPVIKNCGVRGNIYSLAEGDTIYNFVGGIAGFLYGELYNNYSLASFSQQYNIQKDYIGSVLGSAYVEGTLIRLTPLNNVVLSTSSTEVHIGCLVYGSSIVSGGVNTDANFILTVNSEQELMAKEVYWNE